VQNLADDLRIFNPCCHICIDYMNNDQLNWLQELTAQSFQFLVGVLHAMHPVWLYNFDQSFCGWYGIINRSHVTKS